MQTGIRRIITGLFLTLFVCYYANATLFEHCHVINGVTIVHSHFHHESHHTTPTGGHTTSSLTLIASLNSAPYLSAGDVPCDLSIHPLILELTAGECMQKVLSVPVPFHDLRAPPVL